MPSRLCLALEGVLASRGRRGRLSYGGDYFTKTVSRRVSYWAPLPMKV
jgi:hypothetical protein